MTINTSSIKVNISSGNELTSQSGICFSPANAYVKNLLDHINSIKKTSKIDMDEWTNRREGLREAMKPTKNSHSSSIASSTLQDSQAVSMPLPLQREWPP
ncbi:hypothetical protein [Variovorax sp. RO1]|uniref:hypothetical protein n=1 Tax=Variovorax sp. RO1 TaxID=2066034 RepID=UPI00117F216C|nr:hypothetical protein [Variovorax sp. RO1]